jgi:hypothetical protein
VTSETDVFGCALTKWYGSIPHHLTDTEEWSSLLSHKHTHTNEIRMCLQVQLPTQHRLSFQENLLALEHAAS